MQLQNFECQIAKAQIGRYVAGDQLSDEALHQLEAHVGKCQECKQDLAERRTVLQAMLSPSSEGVGEPAAKSGLDLAGFIKSRVQSKQPARAAVQVTTTKPTLTKPALYSIALGAVLIGMSYMSKNMTSVLGPKAAESVAQTQSSQKTPPRVLAAIPSSTGSVETDSFANADAIATGASTAVAIRPAAHGFGFIGAHQQPQAKSQKPKAEFAQAQPL